MHIRGLLLPHTETPNLDDDHPRRDTDCMNKAKPHTEDAKMTKSEYKANCWVSRAKRRLGDTIVVTRMWNGLTGELGRAADAVDGNRNYLGVLSNCPLSPKELVAAVCKIRKGLPAGRYVAVVQ